MKILMIGTPVCTKCKKMLPEVAQHCLDNNIDFEYINLNESSTEILEILSANHITQAPAYLLYREGEEVVVMSGEVNIQSMINLFLSVEKGK